MAMAVAVAVAVGIVMGGAVAMAVGMVMGGVVALAMAVVMVAVAVVNFKECKNGLDDSWICVSGAVHGLPVAGVAIRLLSLSAG